ncbi:type IV-A pilus assembly ATPase PilB [Legionella sp. 29fVS95]|uniref:type IV-A pilus assembly ATPase PilB n=1 Tax=Legionella sp. 29fVS95 TaxID=3402813 RepID=UPI003AF5BD02
MEKTIKPQEQLQGIIQLLVQNKLITTEKALEYQQIAFKNKQTLLQYLISEQLFCAQKLAQAIAEHYCVPFIDLDSIDINSISHTLINEHLIRRHHIVPLFIRCNRLLLATDDPGKPFLLKEIQFHAELPVSIVVVESDKLGKLINKILSEKEKHTPPVGLTYLENYAEPEELAPAIQFVNHCLQDAISKRASDIHFEPYEHQYRIRYRRDGLLFEATSPPLNLTNQITSRIKVMANLDISERRVPQDGHFKMKISHTRTIDCRVNTCPTIYGEKIVIRVLEQALPQLGIAALGFNTVQKKQFLTAITQPQGLILVTGPTGSGKTISLYSALALLNSEERNISTVEDPVEIKIPGINQVNINTKAGLTFPTILRAFLRQDPDVIMVGEIRDLETAEIAIKAAQTGHLVLSTLHTNSAAETLNRLLNMGILPFNIACTIRLVVAQRLVRRLCLYCKLIRNDIPSDDLIKLGFHKKELCTLQLYKSGSCKQCINGYYGQIALFELLPMTQTITELVMAGGNSVGILQQAQREGMITIYQSGLEKIKQGLTTIEEVQRVALSNV